MRKLFSRALVDQYIQGAALRAYALVAAVLTALFSLLEFVEQLAFVGQGHYRLLNALAYVLLTAPERLLQVAPVTMLLGSLLALNILGRSSELTVFRSLGISESRIVGSMIAVTLPIVLGLFLLSEFVIPPAQRLAQLQHSAALSSFHSENRFWASGNGQYLSVRRFEGGVVPVGIDIFAFDAGGGLASYIHADRADIRPDGIWQLSGVVRKRVEAAQFRSEPMASLSWLAFISPAQTRLLMLPLASMPPVALYRYVQQLKRQKQTATRYEQALWTKISFPLSMIAMTMIAAPFVFRSTRAQTPGLRIAIGASIGIVFSLSQQITQHAGLLLDINPAVTALAPSLLLMALAFYLTRRTRD